MQLLYEKVETWPKLAWYAYCEPSGNSAEIRAGSSVEIAEDRFFEAAWDDDFEAGAFDKTDIVCGSGGRLRGEALTFVSSGHTLDRLVFIEKGDALHVSNSLPCILEMLGAEIDITYRRYFEDFYATFRGLNDYNGELCTSKGKLRLLFFDNLVWSSKRWAIVEKPQTQQSFDCFKEYENYLQGAMSRLVKNLGAIGRSFPYGMISTTSSGYDSSTVTVLASQHGCDQTLSFDKTHTGVEDAGEGLAKQLGLKVHVISGSQWVTEPMSEVPFLAANAMGEEVRFNSAAKHLADKVLFTGYHGDKVWAKEKKYITSGLLRGDPSGSALTEFRLSVGFLHCVVPFWGARKINEIHKISCSKEMEQWSVGGVYDRPICRRIVESRGIARGSFGTIKKNASQIRHNDKSVLADSSKRSYMRWLSRNYREFLKRGKLPPIPSKRFDSISFEMRNSLIGILRVIPVMWRLEKYLEGSNYSRRFLFPWSIQYARRLYKAN